MSADEVASTGSSGQLAAATGGDGGGLNSGGEDFERLSQQGVAGEDGGGLAKLGVAAWPAAAQ